MGKNNGISCAERQRRKGGVKKSKRPTGDMREDLNTHACKKLSRAENKSIDIMLLHASLLVELSKAIKVQLLTFKQVPIVYDYSNQGWFNRSLALFKVVYPDMHITMVVSRSGSETIKGSDDNIRLVVPNGPHSQIGANEDPVIARCLGALPGPVILVSGDGKMKAGENYIYNAICKRIQRGLITFIFARRGSISKELTILQTCFPCLLHIVEAELGDAKKA